MHQSKNQNPKIKIKSEQDLLLDRIRRVKGQVEGVEKMISDNQSCIEVINQIMAVRSALAMVATKLLTQESCKVTCRKDQEKFEEVINKLLNFN